MSQSSAAVALAVPTAQGWDFGDFPYGLEPLTLPQPGDSWFAEAAATVELEDAYHGLLDLGSTVPATEADLDRLFWFRWITGHHISFLLWRLLSGSLNQLSTGDCDRAATSRAIVEYVRGYSAMLLYTGSSTRQIYNATIRPSMYRLHSTFSGTWSMDYAAVRSLFRGRRLPPVVAAESDNLAREVGLGHQIHLGVAAKLVVDGKSLLQHLVDNPAAHQPRMWAAIFDCYFLTLRAPVSGPEILSQLLRRCKAVAMDLAANGLYPAVANYPDPTPDELATPAVLACENDLTDTVLRIAGLATGCLRP